MNQYKITKDPDLLCEVRAKRNRLNSVVEKVKIGYMKDLLYVNRRDPKKVWRNIKSIIENDESNFDNISFKNPDTGVDIDKEEACDFVNEFFATIGDRTCKIADTLPYIPGAVLEKVFNFLPLENYDIMMFGEAIDSSSGLVGINSKLCKIFLLHLPEKLRMIFANCVYIYNVGRCDISGPYKYNLNVLGGIQHCKI